jgi:hypothetical protein
LVSDPARVPFVSRPAQALTAEGRPIELFREVYQLVHQRYVTSPDDSKLIEGAIKGLMRNSILIPSIWICRPFEQLRSTREVCSEVWACRVRWRMVS